MEGWISIYRKIQEHWLWTKKRKFSQFEAWISLLLKANYKDTRINFDGRIIELKKGSFITSEVKLSDEWMWNRDTVRKFLKILEDEKMIRKTSTTKYTSISIENWELYQNQQQQNTQAVDNTFPKKYTTDYTSETFVAVGKKENEQQQNIQVVDSRLDTDNKDNNIYLYLLNKYRVENRRNFSEYIQKVRQLKEDENYIKLSLEEQERIISEI